MVLSYSNVSCTYMLCGNDCWIAGKLLYDLVDSVELKSVELWT